MYKLEIKLKQHTPIIHFQHDQEGATLRATELKPKLDRYLIEHAFNDFDEYKKLLIGYDPAQEKKLGKNKYMEQMNGKAFDYKIKIIQRGRLSNLPKDYKGNLILPMFFGNLGGKNKNDNSTDDNFKKPVLYQSNGEENEPTTLIKIFSFNKEVVKLIKQNIASFFAETNFGMRQSKGYGSFYLHPSDDLYVPLSSINGYMINFSLQAKRWELAMQQLDDFYKLLRSGINRVKNFEPYFSKGKVYNNGSNAAYYCKPVIFFYAMNKLQKQWDKKSIKEKFFSQKSHYKRKASRRESDWIKEELAIEKPVYEVFEPGIITQKEIHSDDGESPIHYQQKEPGNLLLLRDLFGLSTDQSWRSYAAKVFKEHNYQDKENKIDRFKSPLTFKIIKNHSTDQFDVYLFADEISSKVLGEDFKVTVKSEKDKYSGMPYNSLPNDELKLSFPKEFSWKDFFQFLKNDFSLDKAFTKGKGHPVYKNLNAIIEQIQK